MTGTFSLRTLLFLFLLAAIAAWAISATLRSNQEGARVFVVFLLPELYALLICGYRLNRQRAVGRHEHWISAGIGAAIAGGTAFVICQVSFVALWFRWQTDLPPDTYTTQWIREIPLLFVTTFLFAGLHAGSGAVVGLVVELVGRRYLKRPDGDRDQVVLPPAEKIEP